MNKGTKLEALIASEIADLFAGGVEIHTEIGGPNTVEEAQQQLTERVTRIASECEVALIAALEQAQQRVEELERDETKLIGERDDAEEALADMYQAATGERPEWSNLFSFADAVDAVEQRLGDLEASQLSVKLPRLAAVVWHLSPRARLRTSEENVSDVLEAIRVAGGQVEGD